MIIERQLSNIEGNFREKKIQSAFQLISDLKNKYSKNQRLDNFFKNNKLKYIKKMKINSNQIQELYKKKYLNNIKVHVNELLKHDPSNAYINHLPLNIPVQCRMRTSKDALPTMDFE